MAVGRFAELPGPTVLIVESSTATTLPTTTVGSAATVPALLDEPDWATTMATIRATSTTTATPTTIHVVRLLVACRRWAATVRPRAVATRFWAAEGLLALGRWLNGRLLDRRRLDRRRLDRRRPY